MPRRYAPDGTPLFNGMKPEEFSDADVEAFMATTEAMLKKITKDRMSAGGDPAPGAQ